MTRWFPFVGFLLILTALVVWANPRLLGDLGSVIPSRVYLIGGLAGGAILILRGIYFVFLWRVRERPEG